MRHVVQCCRLGCRAALWPVGIVGRMKRFAGVIAALFFTSCATTADLGDLPLMWESMHATLHVFSPDGKEIEPFQGELIELTGYSFSSGGVGILPGKKHVRYSCPPKDDIVVHDSIPTIEFTFKAGKHYELRCANGAPVVTERQPRSKPFVGQGRSARVQ
jgi:hypothetical protein